VKESDIDSPESAHRYAQQQFHTPLNALVGMGGTCAVGGTTPLPASKYPLSRLTERDVADRLFESGDHLTQEDIEDLERDLDA
jgi:hypothetical protein